MNSALTVVLILAVALAVAAGLTLLWARRNLLLVSVVGDSMAPAYRSGDQVLVRRVAAGRLRTGDVVVADTSLITDEHLRRMAEEEWPGPDLRRDRRGDAPPVPVDAFKDGRMIKRVAAVPGEVLPASVLARPGETRAGGTVVPPGRFVLLGDSPRDSLDSRFFGYVPATHVIGRVVRTISTAR